MCNYSSLRSSPGRLHSSGFTLIELIISIVLIGILAVVGSSMIVDSFSTTRMVNADTASAGQARYALERLAREIREVKYASSKTTPITVCSGLITDTPLDSNRYCISAPSSLSTPLDILPGGNPLTFVNGADASVNFTGTDTTLNLNGSPLGSNVRSLSLVFSTVDDTAPTTSTIRFVVINLTVTDPTSGQPMVQRTRVALRNE